jgi:CRISPR-associated Csx2 family protein
MARKVFISILGAGFYGSCKYASGDFISNETRFVQEATLEYIKAKNWTAQDTALIFLTQRARTDNWNKLITKRMNNSTQSDESYTGLEQLLENMNLPFVPKGINIDDGKDEVEIWKIFSTIYDEIEENDTLYFDLTHSFRYLPMLLLVLGNYSKFLKNTSIAHISYGNYEARNKETNIAQFVDLLPLSKLQDWSVAAKDFIDYGKTADLKNLLDADNNPILRNTRGQNETAQTIKRIAKYLQDFSETILANKLDEIIQKESLHEEIESLRNENENEIISRPFVPLLEEINDKLSPFEKNDLKNVFAATSWCIKHELYQNAYSILLEGIISIVLSLIDEEYLGTTPLMEAKRGILNYISDCKNRTDKEKNRTDKETCIARLRISENVQNDAGLLRTIAGKIWDLIDRDIAIIISGLNSTRNSYMHGGTGTNTLGSFNDVKKRIEEYNKKLFDWYQKKMSPNKLK